MKSRIYCLSRLLALCLLFGFNHFSHAQSKPDPNAAPNDFVQQVADQVLVALKADASVRAGNTTRVNQLVDELIFHNFNF